jgi:hypothetical protein
MGRHFRPVLVEWQTAQSQFIDAEEAIATVNWIAGDDALIDEGLVGDAATVRIDDGEDFVEMVQSLDVEAAMKELDGSSETRHFLNNLKAMEKDGSLRAAISKDGSLELWFD